MSDYDWNHNWEIAGADLEQRGLILHIYGESGSGRSHLALTAPGPIAYFSFAENHEGVITKAVADTGKEVRVCSLVSVALNDSAATKTRAKIELDKFAAL